MNSELLVWRRGTLAPSTKASAQKLNTRKSESAAWMPWNGYTGNRSPRRCRTLARRKNRLTTAWLREEDETTRRKSTAAAHHKSRPKTERRTVRRRFGKNSNSRTLAPEWEIGTGPGLIARQGRPVGKLRPEHRTTILQLSNPKIKPK
jgi:hypothetical protein